MRIIKTAVGNVKEAFIEDRLTDGVNIIFSNDNSKGKTIIFQGMMYALGNEPIFPGGFDYRTHYFYTCFEHEGTVYEFLRRNDSISVKMGVEVRYFEDTSELKRFVDQKIFPVPKILKDKLPKMVDMSLLYQIFFVGQDKRDPSSVFLSDYYKKADYLNMIYSMTDCLSLEDTVKKLAQLRKDLASCNEEIERINKRITFYKDHPEIASRVSQAADRLIYEKKRQELESLYASISTLQRKRDRLNNRIMKLKALLTELNSLNIQLKNSRICCLKCGSTHVGFVSGDLSFDLTNELVRKNIIQSIKDNIQAYTDTLDETNAAINQQQADFNRKSSSKEIPMIDVLFLTEEIRSYAEDEEKLRGLLITRDSLKDKIKDAEQQVNTDANQQKRVLSDLLDRMNRLYKIVDPTGQQKFTEVFAKKNVTFSGCDEQEYYFSRTLALLGLLEHPFPIIIDCFRKGELSTKKENAMIEEYRKTRTQVILSATLKDEEYTSGSKYYDMPGVNAIDYEMNQDSHILQNKHVDAFGELVRSFGVTFT